MNLPNRFGFLLVFTVPALLPAGYLLGQWTGMPNLCAFLPIIVLDGLLPILDHLMGTDPRNPESEASRDGEIDLFYEMIVLGCLPVVEDDGHLVGLVTERNYMYLAEHLLKRAFRGVSISGLDDLPKSGDLEDEEEEEEEVSQIDASKPLSPNGG